MVELIILIIAVVVAFLVFKQIKQAQIKKGTSKGLAYFSSGSIAALAFIVVLVAGATTFTDTGKIKSKDLKVISVSDYDFTMDDKQSVSIYIGESQSNYYNITINRDQVKQGLSLTKDKENYIKSIDATAAYEKNFYYFLIKDDFNSYLKFDIKKLDHDKKEAVISIKALLYNPDSKDEIKLAQQDFNIKGKLFDNFTK